MKATLDTGIRILAASLALVSAHASAAEPRFGNKPAHIVQVAVATAPRDHSLHSHLAPRAGDPEDLSPLAYDAFDRADGGLDGRGRFSPNAVRLYPIGGGEGAGGGTGAAPAREVRAEKEPARNIAGSKKTLLPEPGSWAMILAGLLGVGAIARRRMSA